VIGEEEVEEKNPMSVVDMIVMVLGFIAAVLKGMLGCEKSSSYFDHRTVVLCMKVVIGGD